MSTASIAVPEAFRYIFWGGRHHRGSAQEAVMDWARLLACVTGTVDQERLARNEYLATENRILKDRLMLSDAERATLGEIGHRLGRKVLAEVATVARPARSWPGTASWSPVNSLARRLVKVRADRGSSARWSN